ncbi:MAG: FAD-dependent oxidoreductase [Actinomycetota bacterium]|nr:FAD-dependent oxidoreductase [Actinomycetota bacterium]
MAVNETEEVRDQARAEARDDDIIVIVGAGLGGCKTAEGLRQGGFAGRLVLISAESVPPYDRPPLSKQLLLGTFGVDDLALLTRSAISELDLELRLGVRAIGLDDHTVLLDDGTRVAFRKLVIATGVSARRLSVVEPDIQHRVVTLRTLDDSLALRGLLVADARVVIVGGGFIGAEVATAARRMGCSVTVLEALDGPCVRVVGGDVSEELAGLYRSNGVDLRVNAAVTAIRRGEDDVAIVEVDGESLPADVVVVGVGTVTELSWLPGSPDVLECGPDGAVVGMTDTLAVGDIAAWPDPWGSHRKIEHWERAGEHARVVSGTLLGENASVSQAAPYFWSDQFGVKVQMCGWSARADSDLALFDPSGRRLRAYLEGETVVAVLTMAAPALLARARPLVARRATLSELVEALHLRHDHDVAIAT